MAVTIFIPTAFRRATQNRDRVDVGVGSVAAALDELERVCGELRGIVRDEGGRVHRHVNVYVNNESIDALDGLDTTLKDGDEVAIISAVAGG